MLRPMNDALQPALYALAASDAPVRAIAIFCAGGLLYAMVALWVLLVASAHARLSLTVVARTAVLLVVSLALAKALNHVILDPRPYLVDHVAPLMTVSHDNGFPSDHVLLAAALTATLWWFARRWIALFAIGTLLVLLGRLGVGAHHLLDVAGSIGIVVVVALVLSALPVPPAWNAPLPAFAARGARPHGQPTAR